MKSTLNKIMGRVCMILILSLTLAGGSAMAKEEILIGAHLPLSGAGAGFGTEQHWAYNKAVADINQAGGIFIKEYGKKLPVRLIVMDDMTNPGKAAAVVTQLINQKKVDLLLSGQGGAYGVIPGMTIAEKYHKYYHGGVIWVPDFLKNDFKWSTMYFFDIGQAATMAYEVWNSLPENQRPKKPAIFMEDTMDGKHMGDGLTALAEKFGYTIALRETMGIGATNFSQQIMKAKANGVDAILCMSNTPEIVALVRQMKQLDFNIKFFQGWKGTWSNDFWAALGKDAEGIFCDGHWSMDYPFPGAKALGERYHNEHKKYSVGVGMYYALCQNLWQAIEKAGTLDGAKIRQAVLDNTFDTVNGPVDYDDKGVAIYPLANFQWKNGKQVVVYPFNLAATQAKTILAWNNR